MAIMAMRVYGVLAGCVPGRDQKTGIDFQKVTLFMETGKKMEFKVMGPFKGLDGAAFGDKLTVNVDSPVLKMANYGDVMFECAALVVAKEQQTPNLKAAA